MTPDRSPPSRAPWRGPCLALALALTLPLGAALPARAADELPSAAATAAAVCAGRVLRADLVAAALDRARAHPELNAFDTLDAEGALSAARARDAQSPASCGVLEGVPTTSTSPACRARQARRRSRVLCPGPTRRWCGGCATPAPS